MGIAKKSGFPQKLTTFFKYATLYDLQRSILLVVNPRYTTPRIESNTENTRHTMCRICDSMRHVAGFRRETVVLQVSTAKYFPLITKHPLAKATE